MYGIPSSSPPSLAPVGSITGSISMVLPFGSWILIHRWPSCVHACTVTLWVFIVNSGFASAVAVNDMKSVRRIVRTNIFLCFIIRFFTDLILIPQIFCGGGCI